ncbi:helix-turn-helix domain-containing protein [Agromyces sp. SYSU K20354]|uniref:helix-turn-helix transcriptional regulator n=1 Tax=Agromyces cavernae TaxID=2898659 RepID=UPI001E413BAD|nr:helix-turn-helix domain-containing protein [Agromyces cavernae]MCD2444269.1 helix-turn-helix domain-containing protein [Agromyces cavernae]
MASDESGYESGYDDELIAVRALGDPTRHRVYTAVARNTEPMSRDQIAALLDLPRSTAAFHLERLADAGLLTVEFRRLTGRTGPGSGRPAKVYVRPDAELSVSIPRRHYELAGEIMAEAIGRAVGDDVPVRDALHAAAVRGGRRLAGASADLDDALERAGLEPRVDGDDTVLGTCPFHRLARENPGVVCEINHAMLCGMAEAVGDDPGRVHLDAGAGRCCIRIAAAP